MTTTVDVTPAAVAVRGTYIDAVAIDELFVDHSYQRPLDTARARQLARGWDRRLAGVVEVSDRGASQAPRYAIIDGQHRWAAAQLLEPAPMMVATIHEGLAVADEAALFDRLNRERRDPPPGITGGPAAARPTSPSWQSSMSSPRSACASTPPRARATSGARPRWKSCTP